MDKVERDSLVATLASLPEQTRRKREELGLNVRDMSYRLGMAPMTLSKFENGGTPAYPVLLKIIDWLADDTPLEYNGETSVY